MQQIYLLEKESRLKMTLNAIMRQKEEMNLVPGKVEDGIRELGHNDFVLKPIQRGHVRDVDSV